MTNLSNKRCYTCVVLTAIGCDRWAGYAQGSSTQWQLLRDRLLALESTQVDVPFIACALVMMPPAHWCQYMPSSNSEGIRPINIFIQKNLLCDLIYTVLYAPAGTIVT
jgi:hypothetical protein